MRRGPKIVALLARRDETAAGKTGELTRNPMWRQDALPHDSAPRGRRQHQDQYLKRNR
jgi:hypothetical protein